MPDKTEEPVFHFGDVVGWPVDEWTEALWVVIAPNYSATVRWYRNAYQGMWIGDPTLRRAGDIRGISVNPEHRK